MDSTDEKAKPTSATFRMFRGTWTSWNELFQQAADFATAIGKRS